MEPHQQATKRSRRREREKNISPKSFGATSSERGETECRGQLLEESLRIFIA